ncbi:MAG: hypothetical protein WDM90_00085 [Ferruginibacter sp.]
MKKIAGLALIMFCCFAATAQTDLKKKIVDSTCACLSETPDIDKKSQEELQMLIGQCMMKKSMTDFMALVQERNLDMTDMEGMQKLGAEIGLDLMKSDCKAMTAIVLKMSQSQGKGDAEDKGDKIVLDYRVVKGTVKAVLVKDFVYVTVLNGAKSTELVWSDVVTNGTDYAKNLNKLLNKNIEFQYTEQEVYSIKAKAYITVKMIKEVK